MSMSVQQLTPSEVEEKVGELAKRGLDEDRMAILRELEGLARENKVVISLTRWWGTVTVLTVYPDIPSHWKEVKGEEGFYTVCCHMTDFLDGKLGVEVRHA